MGNSRMCRTERRKAEADPRLRLFVSMLKISAFTFGGGFVIVTLMKKRFVDEYGWISEQEMLDMTALAQCCPGAIAVNAAILMGWRVAGMSGMIAAVLGTVTPPVAILSVISLCYEAFAANAWVRAALFGMQAGVTAVILNVAWDMGRKVLTQRDVQQAAVMAAAFAAVIVFDLNAVSVILLAAAAGAARFMAERRQAHAR